MAALFSFRDVSLAKGDRLVLDAVTVDLPDTGVTAVVGASGAGKSTLLRCCNRLEAPTEGHVLFCGRDVAGVDWRAHRRRVAMVFQRPTPFPGTVLDNLHAGDPALSPADAEALLVRVALDPGLIDQPADTLSGGEAQRMVIARALTTSPEVLLADEATSALDATATNRLETLARTLAEQGLPVIWVTHDLAQVHRLADHLVIMRAGQVAWTGEATAPEAAAAVTDALDDGGPTSTASTP